MDISFKTGNEKFNYRVYAMMNVHNITICRVGELQLVKQQKMQLSERFKKSWGLHNG
jgi:hypothetical protein